MSEQQKEQQLLETVDRIIAEGPYQPAWSSLMQTKTPDWFKQKRFGIFIHWGVYSVPANSNEWYPRNMYIEGMPAYEHHIKTYGSQKDFGYKDFIPMFHAEKFDPAEWVRLFKEAGAGYVFPVAEHHDGFQMYKSELSHWNSAEMGPKRDVLGELKAEIEKQGLTFCTSSHRAEHWFFLGHGKEFDSDIKEPLQKGDLYWPSMPEPDLMLQAFFNSTAAGGVFVTKLKLLSAYTVITTGMIRSPLSAVLALNCFVNSTMFTPCCPSAGPTGGAGVALPAGICNLIYPSTFFAIVAPPIMW